MKKIFLALVLIGINLYADLPADVQRDMYLQKLAPHVKSDDYSNTGHLFEKIDNLINNHNIKIPNKYYFFKSKYLLEKNNLDEAKQVLEYYFNNTTKKNKSYQEALSLYSKIEDIKLKNETIKKHWEDIKDSKAVALYKYFLELYPNSSYSQEAIELINTYRLKKLTINTSQSYVNIELRPIKPSGIVIIPDNKDNILLPNGEYILVLKKNGYKELQSKFTINNSSDGLVLSFALQKVKTWIDPNTNLMWQNTPFSRTRMLKYDEAISYCNNLTLDGFNDWRVPSPDEFTTLLTKKFVENSGSEHINSNSFGDLYHLNSIMAKNMPPVKKGTYSHYVRTNVKSWGLNDSGAYDFKYRKGYSSFTEMDVDSKMRIYTICVRDK